MTDNDWIKQLQSMMEHHEEPVPDNLWQDIEAQLPEQQARRPLPTWRRYAAAAAVVLAVIGTGYLFWPASDSADTVSPEQPNLVLTEEDNAAVPTEGDYFEAKAVHEKEYVHSRSSSSLAHRAITQPQHQGVSQPNEDAQPTPKSEASTTEEPVQTTDRDTTTAKPSAPRLPITAKEEPNYASATPSRTAAPSPKNRPVSVGFYAANKFPNLNKGNGGDLYGYSGVADPNRPGSHPQDSITQGGDDGAAMSPGRRYAPHRASNNHATHHAPYSLGMSVSVPLTDRLALTSGLVYTRLKSDFSSGAGNREQTLHYLGVPLGATYSLWTWRFVNLYAIGGMQADFNIKATLKDPSLASDINITKDRVQFSGMLGPGLQFNVSHEFGIYVEPTARYYFNNGSNVENYFKDKPWTINLNAGLRLTLQ